MTQPGRPQPLPPQTVSPRTVSSRDARRIPMPAVALDQWLAEINDPAELKTTLRAIALLASEPARAGAPPSLSLDDLLDDPTLRRAAELGDDRSIRNALAAALTRKTLVAAQAGGEVRLFHNDQQTQAYLAKTGLTPLPPSRIAAFSPPPPTQPEPVSPAPAAPPRDNIFALYERHIGPFGHGMAEQLRAAEEYFPIIWIQDAFEIAAERNIRSWRYVHAILHRWLTEGRPDQSPTLDRRQRDQFNDHGKPGHDPAANIRAEYLDSYRRRHGRLPWEADNAA